MTTRNDDNSDNDSHNESPPSKRQKSDIDDGMDKDDAIVPHDGGSSIRTSSLLEPTMHLTGHKGSVYGLAFDPTGEILVSGSFDMKCLLWNAFGNCENFNVLEGHKNAVLDLTWTHDSEHVVTASADRTVGFFHAPTGTRVKKFQGHGGIVNAVDTPKQKTSSPCVFASASDDRTARVWDTRVHRRNAAHTLEHAYQVTSIAYSSHHFVYTGSIDNTIVAWDIRQPGEKVFGLLGHTDTISCLALHPDHETHLLSHSMDGTLRTWDIRPFCDKTKRHCKTFCGATHNAERRLLKCAWSRDGKMVTGGSADRMVHIWDELTTEELYLLPGHSGCVNTVVFHPKENIIASGSSDKSIYVGELG